MRVPAAPAGSARSFRPPGGRSSLNHSASVPRRRLTEVVARHNRPGRVGVGSRCAVLRRDACRARIALWLPRRVRRSARHGAASPESRPPMTALDSSGQPIPVSGQPVTPSQYGLESSPWRRPAHAPHGACGLSAAPLPGTRRRGRARGTAAAVLHGHHRPAVPLVHRHRVPAGQPAARRRRDTRRDPPGRGARTAAGHEAGALAPVGSSRRPAGTGGWSDGASVEPGCWSKAADSPSG